MIKDKSTKNTANTHFKDVVSFVAITGDDYDNITKSKMPFKEKINRIFESESKES